MIKEVRSLERILGDGIKKLEKNEYETVIVQRRGIYWAKDLKSGDFVTKDCLETLRPCPKDAIGANEFQGVIGKKLKKDVHSGDMMKKDEFI